MLLELVDECKQHIWEFMDVQELCRVACEALDTDTGVLSCQLQRHNASRNLLTREEDCQKVTIAPDDEDKLSEMYDTIDWRLWCRDTHLLTLVRFSFNNTRFAQAMSLKRERSHSVKASSHADKRTRRLQMNCVRWMNRAHRRQAVASQSIQAQNAALSKAELALRAQQVENMIQTTAQEQFGLRKRAMKSLHKFNTQLATGSNLFYDLGALQFVA
ncbi:uncharacterized protein PITG_20133 [Phytophthora infestans T30-4]|uniref:Uncharacterized protein n=1 Tax=Phytophthora infestans (strain T30-4) TaxID=403677 RepID=D0P309_PHYIT|nr:uncharacterized protein PITG_20133 [Phytophthora infestans T30-4]EEY58538.1 conserved hypothetical protein [Phytophthora infestans T30-4]|eukprot:XP_002895313.1 conserved hypothetical protein [Phytophthora infestans T30-4]